MTSKPQDPIREVPVTEIISPGSSSTPARHSSDAISDHEHRLPASMPVLPSPRTGLRVPWLIGIVTLLAILGAGAWYWWTAGAPPVHYNTALVDRGPITAIVTATGTVNPVVSVQVGSQVSGKITQLMVDFNSVVTKGQVLATIDPQPFQARVSQARASLKSGRGNLAKAKNMANQRKLELDRMTTLLRQQFVSQADLDLAATNFRDAQAQVEVAQAQVDQAVATLASAELDLGYTTIYSPVNGIVVSRNVDVGQTVAASFQTPTLFVIAQNLTQMQVDTNVSESDIGGVAEGKPANFRVDAYPKQFFEGTVTQVRNAPDQHPERGDLRRGDHGGQSGTQAQARDDGERDDRDGQERKSSTRTEWGIALPNAGGPGGPQDHAGVGNGSGEAGAPDGDHHRYRRLPLHGNRRGDAEGRRPGDPGD